MSILQQTRIKAQLSIEDVSRQLNIRKHYIIALEEDRLDEIPSAVYAQGYLKIYSKFLGVENIAQEKEKLEAKSNNAYTKVVDTLGGRNNLGLTISVIFALIVGTWFYMIVIQNTHDDGLVKNLENLEPTNYMLNIQEPRRDVEDIMKVDLPYSEINRAKAILQD